MPEPTGQALEAAPTIAETVAPVETEVAAPAAAEEHPGEIDLADLPDNGDEARAILYGGAKLKVPIKEVAEEQPSAEEAAPAAEAEKPVAEEADPVPTMPNRIATAQFDDDGKRALSMMHALNEGRKPGDPGFVSLSECVAKVAEMSRPKEAARESAPSPIDTAQARVTSAKTALSDLRAQRTELESYGTDTGEIEAKIATAEESLVDAKLDAKLAEREVAASKAQQNAKKIESVVTQREQSKADAIKRFKSLDDIQTPLGAKIAERIAAMKDPQHPDHQVLNAPNAPLIIAKDVAIDVAEEQAQLRNIPFAQAYQELLKSKPAPPTPQAEAAARKVLPASGTNRTTTPTAAPSGDQILADVGNDADKAAAALYKNQPISFLQ